MKKYLQFFFLAVFPTIVFAQFAVVSTQPVNSTKNVPLTTTVSVTFNEALDTNAIKQNERDTWFSNIDSTVSEGYSVDLKTKFATVVLKPNHSYFLAFIYVKAKSGAVITTPYVYYFTTGADFAPYSVSGIVFSGSTGVLPEGSIVALANVNIMKDEGKEGPPPFSGWTNVNSNGSYTVPNLINGTYWPIAIKDVDHDGFIRPDNGMDVIAFGDSIIVNNASLTNINLTFVKFTPYTSQEALKIADSLSAGFPSDKMLKRVSIYNADTLGRGSWNFAYTMNNNTIGKEIQINPFGSGTRSMDQGYFNWVKNNRTITNAAQAAPSATVMANAEASGGKIFRQQQVPPGQSLQIQMDYGDMTNSKYSQINPNTSQNYWGVSYEIGYRQGDTSFVTLKAKYFLCNFTTGVIVAVGTTGVSQEKMNVPDEFLLSQNYPNPFNPTTNISFSIPSSNVTSLKIFDLLGKEVAVLVNEKKDAGEYTVPFNAARLPSGIYFYQLRSGNFVETKKMLLIK